MSLAIEEKEAKKEITKQSSSERESWAAMEGAGEALSEESHGLGERTTSSMEAESAHANGEAAPDLESNNSLQQPLLRRTGTLSASHLAIVGAKVSHIESLDYEYVSLFSVSVGIYLSVFLLVSDCH